MQFEVDRETEPERLEALVGGIRRVLSDVRAAVEDWPMMRQRMHEIVAGFVSAAPPLDRSEVEEVNAFLEWVDGGNFIFLGYREYDLVREAGEDLLRAVDGSGLGVLRHRSAIVSASFARLPADVRAMARTPQPLILTKANSRSTVHRPLYLDYIGVKRFDGGRGPWRTSFPRLVHDRRRGGEPAQDPDPARQGRARHTPGGVPH